MRNDMQRLMGEALRLTRSGDLRAASAALSSALSGTVAGMPSVATPPTGQRPVPPPDMAAGGVIDVEAREVAEAHEGVAARKTPGADTFTTGHHAEAGSARDFKLYIPPHAGSRPLPLVVMLHGCTQHPDDFAAGTGMNALAREQGCFVLYPAQSQQMNPQRCWNWFKHTHQQRDRGEPALIAGMVRAVMAAHAIDPARVYVAGLSAGGAMAAILGATYPELFAAVGVHSGLAAGAATDLPSALGAMQSGAARTAPGGAGQAASGMPTIVFHGDGDTTVHPANGRQVIAASVGPDATGQVAPPPAGSASTRRATRTLYRGADGRPVAEHWAIHGAGHAWAGGRAAGSYTDPQGPDASTEMLRFFREHPRPAS